MATKACCTKAKMQLSPLFSVQFSSISQSCPTLCDPMDCSMSGFPVHIQLPELTQTHVHRVRDAIQPSDPVIPFSSCLQSFPTSGSFPMSQFFTSGGQNIVSFYQVSKLELVVTNFIVWFVPLLSPSPPACNLSQHQGLFQWVSSSHQVAKVLEFQLQHQSVLPMNTQDWSPLGWTGWISLQPKGLARVFSNTTVQKHQFFGAQLSL